MPVESKFLKEWIWKCIFLSQIHSTNFRKNNVTVDNEISLDIFKIYKFS